MTSLKRISSALLLALCASCDSPTGSQDRSVFMVVPEQVTLGSLASGRLINQSGDVLHIGGFPCGMRTDRQSEAGWTEVPGSGNECPQPDFTLADGAEYGFGFRAPAATGTFRLRTFSEGDSVFSNVFTVQ